MLFAALCMLGILLSEPIEPVTSSTIATRIRALPQVDVAPLLKPSFGKLKAGIFAKSLFTYPFPLTMMVDCPVVGSLAV